MDDPLLRERIDYYEARTAEYDEWFLRQGSYDLGAEQNARWYAEIGEVRGNCRRSERRGRVLELAGGTGFWTPHLARTADELTVVDASSETLKLKQLRVRRADVRYLAADIFQWPDGVLL